MMKPKVIKTEADYKEALAHLEGLMNESLELGNTEEMELFAALIETYENEHFPIDLPDPIEAIKFRMEQAGLERKDLVKYIGSQSKVSEVLNYKRPLSIAMVRELHKGLGIPAEVLLKTPGKEMPAAKYDYRDFPFVEMYRQGYFRSFNGSLKDAKDYAETLLNELFSVFQGHLPEKALCRNSEGSVNDRALEAWQARVLELANEQDVPTYASGTLTEEKIRDIVKLSYLSDGPLLAKERLQKYGIPLIILKHLPGTYLDGACFNSPTGRPIIGMTLRHDRMDNFWFTLAHELAHVHLHLVNSNTAFFDDTEHGVQKSRDRREVEADRLASNLLIPDDEWEFWRSETGMMAGNDDVIEFANNLGISPAIIAGRLRWELQDYKIFDALIGRRSVKKIFGEAR